MVPPFASTKSATSSFLKIIVIVAVIVTSPLLVAGENQADDFDVRIPGLTQVAFSFSSAGRPSTLFLVIFEPDKFQLTVLDNGDQPKPPLHVDLPDALKKNNAIAGINGGYFGVPDFKPVGLVIAQKQRLGTWTKEGLDGVLVIRPNHITLESTAEFKDHADIDGLLQGSPWLLQNGKPNAALKPDEAPVRRSFIAVDDKGRTAIGYCSRVTLFELSQYLSSPAVTSIFTIQSALNLDGGPSSTIASTLAPKPFHLPAMWPVRNYLVLRPVPRNAMTR